MIFNWYKVKVAVNRGVCVYVCVCVCVRKRERERERERERKRERERNFGFFIDEVETTERSVKLYIVE